MQGSFASLTSKSGSISISLTSSSSSTTIYSTTLISHICLYISSTHFIIYIYSITNYYQFISYRHISKVHFSCSKIDMESERPSTINETYKQQQQQRLIPLGGVGGSLNSITPQKLHPDSHLLIPPSADYMHSSLNIDHLDQLFTSSCLVGLDGLNCLLYSPRI